MLFRVATPRVKPAPAFIDSFLADAWPPGLVSRAYAQLTHKTEQPWITMRKVDGWETLNEPMADQPIDLAA